MTDFDTGYITKEDAIEHIDKAFADYLISSGFPRGYESAPTRVKLVCDGMMDAVNAIFDTPTVDVRENTHGKWIGVNPLTDTLQCSVCGYNILDEEFKSKFCPECGADMRGES